MSELTRAFTEILGGLACLALPVAIILLVRKARRIQARQQREVESQKDSIG